MSVQYNSHKKLVEDIIKNKVKYENKDIKNIKEKFFSSDKDSFKIIIDFIKKIIKKRKTKNNFYLNFYNILRLKFTYTLKNNFLNTEMKNYKFSKQKRKNFNLNFIINLLNSHNIFKQK